MKQKNQHNNPRITQRFSEDNNGGLTLNLSPEETTALEQETKNKHPRSGVIIKGVNFQKLLGWTAETLYSQCIFQMDLVCMQCRHYVSERYVKDPACKPGEEKMVKVKIPEGECRIKGSEDYDLCNVNIFRKMGDKVLDFWQTRGTCDDDNRPIWFPEYRELMKELSRMQLAVETDNASIEILKNQMIQLYAQQIFETEFKDEIVAAAEKVKQQLMLDGKDPEGGKIVLSLEDLQKANSTAGVLTQNMIDKKRGKGRGEE